MKVKAKVEKNFFLNLNFNLNALSTLISVSVLNFFASISHVLTSNMVMGGVAHGAHGLTAHKGGAVCCGSWLRR